MQILIFLQGYSKDKTSILITKGFIIIHLWFIQHLWWINTVWWYPIKASLKLRKNGWKPRISPQEHDDGDDDYDDDDDDGDDDDDDDDDAGGGGDDDDDGGDDDDDDGGGGDDDDDDGDDDGKCDGNSEDYDSMVLWCWIWSGGRGDSGSSPRCHVWWVANTSCTAFYQIIYFSIHFTRRTATVESFLGNSFE